MDASSTAVLGYLVSQYVNPGEGLALLDSLAEPLADGLRLTDSEADGDMLAEGLML